MTTDRSCTKAQATAAAIAGVFLFLYVAPLGVRPLVVPDEIRYAEVPREMLASGDWVVPHLNGLRYFEKPVLGYWLNAAAMRLLGENAFAARLPSALAVGLTALILFLWARRFSASYSTGLLSAAVFLLSAEVLAVGVFCILDSVFSLFVTAGMVSFSFADREERPGPRAILLSLAGLACGLAFLTKGFIALVIPTIVIVPFALWQGRLKGTLRAVWLPLLVAILVVLPWGIMIHRREPGFWHYFFWVEHLGRFASPKPGQHPAPFWYFVPIIVGGAIPWTFLAEAVGAGLRHTGLKDPMVRFAICWLVLPFLFFSASSGKVATYILPCFPPLAFLIAVGLLKSAERGNVRAFVGGARITAVGGSLLLLALLVSLFAMPRLSASVGVWRWLLVALGLLVWTGFSWAIVISKNARKQLVLYCVGPLLFLFGSHFVVPALTPPKKIPEAFLLSNVSRIPQDGIVVSDSGLAGAVCWFYKRNDVLIVGGKGEYEYGLDYADSKHRLLRVDEFNELAAETAGDGCVTLVLTAGRYGELKPRLAKPTHENIDQGLAFVQFASPPASVEAE